MVPTPTVLDNGMDWLHGISITCFAASYLVVFLFEISRVFFRMPLQKYLTVLLTVAGLFAHAVFLHLQTSVEVGNGGIWMGSWSDWCLAGGLALALAYLWVSIRQPKSNLGLFILPLVMVLVGLGNQLRTVEGFTSTQARTMWNMLHGSALLAGTVVVALGFVFGVIYLVLAYRLKKKLPPSRFRMPSLEWLQVWNERSLVISVLLLALGLASGIVINLINGRSPGGGTVAWSDPVVWSSGVLLLWLVIVLFFNLLYRPARQGRKVAYLVVASFVFLLLELGIVWWVGHGQSVIANSSAWLEVVR